MESANVGFRLHILFLFLIFLSCPTLGNSRTSVGYSSFQGEETQHGLLLKGATGSSEVEFFFWKVWIVQRRTAVVTEWITKVVSSSDKRVALD